MNAKEEFLKVTKDFKVICAEIDNNKSWYEADERKPTYLLKIGHTPEEYKDFVNSLNFNYDNGFGGQELYGTIWCEGGVWLERGEYDGSEWWNTYVYPEIPLKLKN